MNHPSNTLNPEPAAPAPCLPCLPAPATRVRAANGADLQVLVPLKLLQTLMPFSPVPGVGALATMRVARACAGLQTLGWVARGPPLPAPACHALAAHPRSHPALPHGHMAATPGHPCKPCLASQGAHPAPHVRAGAARTPGLCVSYGPWPSCLGIQGGSRRPARARPPLPAACFSLPPSFASPSASQPTPKPQPPTTQSGQQTQPTAKG